MKTILEKIHSGEFTYFEGGCGTILQAQGLKPGELPETWNILHPEIISGMHFDYILAGANIHKINTFGASSLKYKDTEGDFVLENVIAKAVENVRIAVNAAKNGLRPDGTA
ncbi:MAG: homocysteine S-methyltransferase family protein, partial [Clostridia bacterium]|nr:homocysteine S-methyltransferase family protein [Clostridia bacterium]